ncbi:MAG: DUF1919 domain-containing protein [Butyrivibrio sp.]|jgi:uncharacterized protein (DUF1919 family)|uniref:DUF1919 domain-containing protein n=1 Tax=Butyrivibrio sp. TaxID=28121 RepID=UPI001EB8097F|nr:DUF1919 domain-containing protein [Butyrivibrio sp.]MBE5840870.1 DUF1919 domain-containing protein [Butyrivibrio sp.]
MSVKSVIHLVKKHIRKILYVNKRKKNLLVRDVSIIASDCTGGVVYNELGLEFKSPTINMFIPSDDFIRFCKNISYWVDQPMIEIDSPYPYPVAQLGENGVKLHLVHYKSVSEAQEKWNARKDRIDYNNLFIIMNDRNGCTYEDMKIFDEMPFENKVLFSHLPHPELKSVYYIKGNEKNDTVPVMTEYVNKLSFRKNIDQFDYVSWINKNL